MNKDVTLDVQGLLCPLPIVQLAKRIKEMKSGQILELVADDVGAKDDVPAWCKRTGNELVSTATEGKKLLFYVKVK